MEQQNWTKDDLLEIMKERMSPDKFNEEYLNEPLIEPPPEPEPRIDRQERRR